MTVRGVSSNPTSALYNANAPALSGSSGALLTVLDAVLVNGFTGFTALGWTIAYTGTNQRQYAMAAGGTSCQLFVNDAAPGAGGAREARITGFKTGTGLGTGTGQFPTTSQMTAPSGALVARKSTTADATARYWTIIGDGNTFYMFVETGDITAPVMAYSWMFGDFFSYSSSDTSNCIIIGRTIENTNVLGPNNVSSEQSVYENLPQLSVMNGSGLSNPISGHYVCANYTNVGSSVQVGKHTDMAKMGCMVAWKMGLGYLGGWNGGGSGPSGTWVTEFGYPNGPDGGLYVAPIWLHHNGFVRGYLKGLWAPLQHAPLSHNDTYSGTGNMSGKSLVAQTVPVISATPLNAAPSVGAGQVHIEYSDTWS